MARYCETALPLLGLLAVSSVFFAQVQGITYAQDVQAAMAAISATPGYVLLSGYKSVITTTLRQYPAQQPPATILAPNDTAIVSAIDTIGKTKKAIYPVVQFHALQGVHLEEELSALPPGTPLPTFNAAGVLNKISPVGIEPVQFKSAKSPKVGSITKIIYKGTYIVVYGFDSILLP